MNEKYIVSAQTRIGYIHLKVADIQRSLAFYCDLLGFELTTMYGSQVAFISAGGYHHIGLCFSRTHRGRWLVSSCHSLSNSQNLAFIYKRLWEANYPLTGVADHAVSEAIYLNDPDNNGVELYWDRPKELWTYQPNGSIEMFTKTLNLNGLLRELL